MSFTASHISKENRRACEACRERKARFQYRGAVKADRDHTLCFECFRRERERQRARQLANVPTAIALQASAPVRTPRRLSERQVAHRKTMLANLARRN